MRQLWRQRSEPSTTDRELRVAKLVDVTLTLLDLQVVQPAVRFSLFLSPRTTLISAVGGCSFTGKTLLYIFLRMDKSETRRRGRQHSWTSTPLTALRKPQPNQIGVLPGASGTARPHPGDMHVCLE